MVQAAHRRSGNQVDSGGETLPSGGPHAAGVFPQDQQQNRRSRNYWCLLRSRIPLPRAWRTLPRGQRRLFHLSAETFAYIRVPDQRGRADLQSPVLAVQRAIASIIQIPQPGYVLRGEASTASWLRRGGRWISVAAGHVSDHFHILIRLLRAISKIPHHYCYRRDPDRTRRSADRPQAGSCTTQRFVRSGPACADGGLSETQSSSSPTSISCAWETKTSARDSGSFAAASAAHHDDRAGRLSGNCCAALSTGIGSDYAEALCHCDRGGTGLTALPWVLRQPGLIQMLRAKAMSCRSDPRITCGRTKRCSPSSPPGEPLSQVECCVVAWSGALSESCS